MSLCLKDALTFGITFLKEKAISSYALDASVLLSTAAGLTKTELYTNDSQLLPGHIMQLYIDMLEKRAAYMPVAYIIQRCEFMGLSFYVDKSVLIPRPDTEILVETVMKYLPPQKKDVHILDMCSGSGCIGISLSYYRSNALITMADICPKALKIAERNAAMHKLSGRAACIHSDMFSQVTGCFDFIVSNPPYIPRETIPTLPLAVQNHEPHSALDGGADGLDFYRILGRTGRKHLKDGGMLFVEIGHNQSPYVMDILSSHGFQEIGLTQDLAGLDRVVQAKIARIKQ